MAIYGAFILRKMFKSPLRQEPWVLPHPPVPSFKSCSCSTCHQPILGSQPKSSVAWAMLGPCLGQQLFLSGWCFGTFFSFLQIGNNHPNWLSYFSEGLKPPTRVFILAFMLNVPMYVGDSLRILDAGMDQIGLSWAWTALDLDRSRWYLPIAWNSKQRIPIIEEPRQVLATSARAQRTAVGLPILWSRSSAQMGGFHWGTPSHHPFQSDFPL